MVDYGPQAPMNTTTVATAVQRRWACHTRTVLRADAYGRQRCNVVLSACVFCCLPVVYVLGCVLVREGNGNRQTLPARTHKIGPIERNRGYCLIHSQRKQTWRARHPSHRARIEIKPAPHATDVLTVST